MKYAQVTIDEKVYNLKLTIDNAVKLEDDLGKNPLYIFAQGVPKLKDLKAVFNYSLEQQDDSLLQKWIDEGHGLNDLSALCIEIFKASGFIQQQEGNSKN